MNDILCIDPGTKESGYVLINDETKKVIDCGIFDNRKYYDHIIKADYVVIEMVASYGMPVSRSIFDTVVSIGRFIELAQCTSRCWYLYTRKDIKKVISNGNAKDSHIRQALIDLYPATGGGKTPQIGTKKEPGPLYGMKSHMWAALAVGIAHLEGCRPYILSGEDER